jgi:hypothetical protein
LIAWLPPVELKSVESNALAPTVVAPGESRSVVVPNV